GQPTTLWIQDLQEWSIGVALPLEGDVVEPRADDAQQQAQQQLVPDVLVGDRVGTGTACRQRGSQHRAADNQHTIPAYRQKGDAKQMVDQGWATRWSHASSSSCSYRYLHEYAGMCGCGRSWRWLLLLVKRDPLAAPVVVADARRVQWRICGGARRR